MKLLSQTLAGICPASLRCASYSRLILLGWGYMSLRRAFAVPFSRRRTRLSQRGSARTSVVGATSAALMVSLLTSPVWAAASDYRVRAIPKTTSVEGTDLAPRKRPVTPSSKPWKPAPVTWPQPGRTEVDLTTAAATAGSKQRAGSLPVKVGASVGKTLAGTAPTKLGVKLLDRTAARRAGVEGLLLQVQRTDGERGASGARIEVDYSSIRDAYGAGWSSRLHLATLPGCALTTPDKPACRTATALPTTNDTNRNTLSGTAPLPAAARTSTLAASDGPPVLLAATAAASGGEGSFAATSLAPSGSWSAGGNSGGFAWNVPLSVPSAPGGLAPKVALNYNSSAVDGRTASTNNQSTWIGEGWEFSPGYVERTYASCENDKQGGNNTEKVGDLCWKSDNATLSLNGSSNQVVWDANGNTGRLSGDDGSRVERLYDTEANNSGDADREYFKVTTQTGTQYFFGKNRLPGWASGNAETNSVFTVPVYGNHAGEQGHAADFASSAEIQGWRWNLDYVVDPHGNAMALYYAKEGGYYAQNNKIDASQPYDRGGYLTKIDYGLRAGAVYSAANPASRVTFTSIDRCLSDCTFDEAHATSWPDTPVDLNCTSSTQCLQTGPVFWSRKRLSSINTYSLVGTTMQPVDTWNLVQSFPATGDTSSPSMWLDSIQRTAKAGALADITLPKTTFTGELRANRVDAAEGRPPLNKKRLTEITNETGGQTLVTYSAAECTTSNLPTPDTNAKRCYPSWWTPEGAVDPVKDFFHKYLVTQVVEDDTTFGTGSASKITSYEYADGPKWRRDTGEFTLDKHRTWSEFRGYGTVRTFVGATNRTKSETAYFTGMAGDTLADGSARPVPTINGIPDRDDFSGRAAQSRTFDKDGPGGKVVAKATFTPWQSGATATQTVTGITDPDKPNDPGPALPAKTAHYSGTATEAAATLQDDDTTWRTLTTTRTYDATYGLLISEGDDGAGTVEAKCARTSYVTPDTANWLIGYPSQVTTTNHQPCSGAYATTAVTGSARTSYDLQAVGTAPKVGQANETKTEQAAKTDTGGALVWETTAQSTYDTLGRVKTVKGQDGQTTTTDYVPTSGAQPTKVTVTNPKGYATSSEFDGLRGLILKATDEANGRTTTTAYDAAGRLVKGWRAGRATTLSPNVDITYTLSSTAPSAVTTKTLYENGTWGTGIALYDSLLRARQSQSDAIGTAGRVVIDTFYDDHGRAYRTNAPFYNASAASTTALVVTDNQVPSASLTEYDGRGRPTAAITLSLNVEKWRTTNTYGATWSASVPPIGGTATLGVSDVRGRLVEQRDYKDRTPLIGDAATGYEKTTRSYDAAGNLNKVTDTSGRNAWTYTYDLRGRKIQSTDPDAGTTITGYGTDGRVQTSTDARGVTLATTYDVLGRTTSLRKDSVTGTKLAEWTYDTAPGGKGLPATSVRYDTTVSPNPAYSTEATGYDSAGEVTGTRVSVPSVVGEEKLAGTYTLAGTSTAVNGLPLTTTYSTGNSNATTALPAETVTAHYGAQDQLAIVDGTLSQVYLRGAGYTPFGELAQASLGNSGAQVIQTNTYDAVTRRPDRSIVDRESTGPATLSNIQYSYDPAGNITRIRDDQNDGTILDDQCFSYDWARRLSEAWTTGDGCTTKPVDGTGTPALGSVDPYWTSWTFTDTGQRASETQHKAGSISADTTRTHTYPTTTGAAQAHGVRSVIATGGTTGTTNYTYDNTGNQLTKTPSTGAAQTLTWNDEGKLATSTLSGATTKFLYDAEGTRLLRRDPNATTLYLPGGQELVLNKSTQTVAGTRYYSVPGGSAVRTSSDGKVRLLVADHHNTNQLSISATTLAANRRKSMPYGGARGTAPAFWPGQKGFVGGDIDPTTGFTHIGAREYDPSIGQFISVDPLLSLEQPQSLNGYSYANNNPTTASDPSGLESCYPNYCAGSNGTYGDYKEENDPASAQNGGVDHDAERQQKAVDEWVDQNTPDTNEPQRLLKRWDTNGRQPNQSGEYWQPTVNGAEDGSGGVLCYGRLGCEKAADYLEETGDVAGAKRVAALYCVEHASECNRDAKIRGAVEAAYHLVQDVVVALEGLKTGRPPTGNCFLAGTDVLMADGSTKNIEDIKVGEKVIATDPETGQTKAQEVTATFVTEGKKNLVDLKIETKDGIDSLTATEGHPFWVASKHAWIDAGDLKTGMTLRTDVGATVTVKEIHSFTKHVPTYNLTVAGFHTYYVLAGETPVLVHNTDCGPEFSIDEGQFGKKWGKHAQDYGLNPGDASARQGFRDKIAGVRGSHDEVRQGPWNPKNGGGNDYFFYRRGNDLLVTKGDGQFVTMFPMSKPNGWFQQATPYSCGCKK
ncbi:polymorphic toxin-type HINT domain-containing protein [Streptomyces sp. NPDC048479]|uniref:polymorphic toxin-type HINT domain-containing protein n=1 Tax=Streptomyces sp. NPDC048479 TaxID=3154725 RepID=UPI003416D41F